MSLCSSPPVLPGRFRLVLTSFLQQDGLPFADVLPEEVIDQACQEAGVEFGQDPDTLFTPAVTLWAFLSQMLHKQEQRSCLAAVSRVIVLLAALSRPVCAKNSGPYCRARAKLSEVVIERLAVTVAAGCEKKVPEKWWWRKRHVKLVDGTTVSMPDTPANQEAYPQSTSQQAGLGFPIARMVVLASLATAMVCGMATVGESHNGSAGELDLDESRWWRQWWRQRQREFDERLTRVAWRSLRCRATGSAASVLG